MLIVRWANGTKGHSVSVVIGLGHNGGRTRRTVIVGTFDLVLVQLRSGTMRDVSVVLNDRHAVQVGVNVAAGRSDMGRQSRGQGTICECGTKTRCSKVNSRGHNGGPSRVIGVSVVSSGATKHLVGAQIGIVISGYAGKTRV